MGSRGGKASGCALGGLGREGPPEAQTQAAPRLQGLGSGVGRPQALRPSSAFSPKACKGCGGHAWGAPRPRHARARTQRHLLACPLTSPQRATHARARAKVYIDAGVVKARRSGTPAVTITSGYVLGTRYAVSITVASAVVTVTFNNLPPVRRSLPDRRRCARAWQCVLRFASSAGEQMMASQFERRRSAAGNDDHDVRMQVTLSYATTGAYWKVGNCECFPSACRRKARCVHQRPRPRMCLRHSATAFARCRCSLFASLFLQICRRTPRSTRAPPRPGYATLGGAGRLLDCLHRLLTACTRIVWRAPAGPPLPRGPDRLRPPDGRVRDITDLGRALRTQSLASDDAAGAPFIYS